MQPYTEDMHIRANFTIRNKRIRRILCSLWAVAWLLSLMACASADPSQPPKPMGVLEYPFTPGKSQTVLLVMLPGINNSPTLFSANGLVQSAFGLGPLDVQAVNAQIRYYMDHSIVDRLHNEVILPAQQRGYRHIWLLGTSMGGFGCLLYAQEHPADIEGIILLAPYLGEGSLEKELRAAGGLAKWQYQSQSGSDDQDRKVREIWYWLQQAYLAPSARLPAIWLAWGSQDRFNTDASNLAAIMPAAQVLKGEGGHDWKTWAKLFSQLMVRESFQSAFN